MDDTTCHSQHRIRKFVSRNKGKILLGVATVMVVTHKNGQIRALENQLKDQADEGTQTVVVVD